LKRDEHDPFERAFAALSTVDKWMSSFFEGQPPPEPTEGHWHPPTDIYETPDGIVVCMEVAGVEPSSIEVNFKQGHLTVSGYRFVGCQSGRCHQVEIENGRFFRHLALPMEVEEEGLRAKSQHGLLEIFLPKRKEAKPRKVSISDESEEPGEATEV